MATKQITENIFLGRKYLRAVGRRKTATARVQLYTGGSGQFVVNKKELAKYFGYFTLQDAAKSPLSVAGAGETLDVNAAVTGGGPSAQSEAVRLALSRALVLMNPELKPALRREGMITVDSRVKERKKPGLKRARRAPQWSKR